MTTPRILIVEDELAICQLLTLNLRHAGYDTYCVGDGEYAQREIDQALPDLIILDWMLPGENGPTLARRWRTQSRLKGVPILMLTARAAEQDKVQGLDAGADDYLAKPFSIQELQARIRALLRRAAPERSGGEVQHGALTLNRDNHTAHYGTQPLKLSSMEFRLLNFLMQYPERVHSRASLLDKVWGDNVFIEERTIDVHIKRLRSALGEAGKMIETVRGVGYRFRISNPETLVESAETETFA